MSKMSERVNYCPDCDFYYSQTERCVCFDHENFEKNLPATIKIKTCAECPFLNTHTHIQSSGPFCTRLEFNMPDEYSYKEGIHKKCKFI